MENFDYRQVDPVRPAVGYIGGKRNLARRLVPMIEAMDHETYCEPFVGMGGVFLRRRRLPRSEVINDASGDVATFFRILQRHYVAFLDHLRFQITSRREFERLRSTDPATLTDIERAARFLYLQRLAFGGKVVGRSFGVSADRPGQFDVTRLQPLLEAIHERLAGVVIECLDYREVLKRYDRSGTLFYLDPPYAGSEGDYGAGFGPEQFQLLADALATLKGDFILSINDTPAIREIFGRFTIEPVQTTYSISGTAAARTALRASELIIRGP